MRWVIRFLFKALIGFLGLSLALVLVFRFIPVPVTATMLMDSNGITKDWTAL
ncbi:MAG TPA: monofunctional biosynthetic peptidoglycan transglycosylase, partial [Erythrobacter sp.]|nr:monofunctional biosynthetic peptidoglycan transglycosylase [Erythrobacter sp.]